MQAPAHSQMPRVLAYHIKVKRSSFKYHFCYLLLSLNWNCWHLLFHIQTSELSYFRSLTTAGFGCTRQTQMITDFFKAKPNLFHKHQVPVMMMILLTSNTGMIVFLIDCSDKHGHIFRPVKSSVPYPSWTLHSWLHDFHLHHSGGVLRSQNFTMTTNEKKHDKTVGTHFLMVLRCIVVVCIIYYQHLNTKSRQLRSQVVEASNGGGFDTLIFWKCRMSCRTLWGDSEMIHNDLKPQSPGA